MKRLAFIAITSLAALGSVAADAAAVPDTVSFTGRVSDGSGPINGTVNLTFEIFDVPTGGSFIWDEAYTGVSASNGLVYVNLGSQQPFTAVEADGGDLYLQITVNGTVQTPRIPINSVPYATHAGTAATLGTLAPGDVSLSTHNHNAAYAAIGHDHNSAYAAIGHDHNSAYAAIGHDHNSDYAPLSHNHDTLYYTKAQSDAQYALSAHTHSYAPLSHGHGSADVDAYQDLSDSGRFGADAATDVLLRSDGDARYVDAVVTNAGSGLDGGCSSGSCTLTVDATDVNAVPSNAFSNTTFDVTDATFVTLVSASITVPAAGNVVAFAGVDPFPINLTTGQSAFFNTLLTTSSTGSTGNTTSTRWNYEPTGFDYKHVSHFGVFPVGAGTTTVYYRGSQTNQGDIRTFNRRINLLFIPD